MRFPEWWLLPFYNAIIYIFSDLEFYADAIDYDRFESDSQTAKQWPFKDVTMMHESSIIENILKPILQLFVKVSYSSVGPHAPKSMGISSPVYFLNMY